MTISIWRYSHLVLALVSFIFILLASVTGTILAFEPISEQIKPYKVDNFKEVSLAETIAAFKKTYPEVIDISVDVNEFVFASIVNDEAESVTGYFNPRNAEYLGPKIEPSQFFQFNTTLHRSLFLKGTGRFFVGLCSFLLFLIAISGTILIVKRQGSFKKIFSKVVNENFAQYWHVVLGRISLIPIIIITLTGVFLSLQQFNVFPEHKISHQINFENLRDTPKLKTQDFPIFKNIKLSEVKSIEFPFSEDIEDYYTVKLKNKELIVNQFNGAILSELADPFVAYISSISLLLHTGKGSIIWSSILAIACINILFFIYSGFAMTLKRRAASIKNKYKPNKCKYIILVGSENGSTLIVATEIHQQILALGETCYLAELNQYREFKRAKHLIVMTSTYGEGDAPTNANKFLDRLKTVKQEQNFSFSVVGFGSLAYPDFCKFAFTVNDALKNDHKTELIPLFTINDKSLNSFEQWLNKWSSIAGLQLYITNKELTKPPKSNASFELIHKTDMLEHPDSIFNLTLKPHKTPKFTSGDLLAVYPKNDYRERLYSIANINNNIQLSVKHHKNGLGSEYLQKLSPNTIIKARVLRNTSFHFPKKASKVIFIANGTGIAPFLGMLAQNKQQIETHLYLGLRSSRSFESYEKDLQKSLSENKLNKLNLALSNETEKIYVQDLVHNDAKLMIETLKNQGYIMICGSLAMHKGVMLVLEKICEAENTNLNSYGHLIKSDCY
jgi:sulfite reductase (NADPH) flavoprotein alpha-component